MAGSGSRTAAWPADAGRWPAQPVAQLDRHERVEAQLLNGRSGSTPVGARRSRTAATCARTSSQHDRARGRDGPASPALLSGLAGAPPAVSRRAGTVTSPPAAAGRRLGRAAARGSSRTAPAARLRPPEAPVEQRQALLAATAPRSRRGSSAPRRPRPGGRSSRCAPPSSPRPASRRAALRAPMCASASSAALAAA